MQSIIDFFIDNYQWIFSGIGVFILSLFFVKKTKNQKQKVDNNSIGIQAGRDVKIENLKKNNKNV